VAETVDPSSAHLGSRAQRVTTGRHGAEFAAGTAQHALAEGLLRAMPTTRQPVMDGYEHFFLDTIQRIDLWPAAIRMPSSGWALSAPGIGSVKI
jgi:hypothetical protein